MTERDVINKLEAKIAKLEKVVEAALFAKCSPKVNNDYYAVGVDRMTHLIIALKDLGYGDE